MNNVIAVCGKLCSEKSTHAEAIRLENQAVILSVDEIMLSLCGELKLRKPETLQQL